MIEWKSGTEMGTQPYNPNLDLKEQLDPTKYYDYIKLPGLNRPGFHMGPTVLEGVSLVSHSQGTTPTEQKTERCVFENETLLLNIVRDGGIRLENVKGDVDISSMKNSIVAENSKLGTLFAYKNIRMKGGEASFLNTQKGDITVQEKAVVKNIKAHYDIEIADSTVINCADSAFGKAEGRNSIIRGAILSNRQCQLSNSTAEKVQSKHDTVLIDKSNVNTVDASSDFIMHNSTVGSGKSQNGFILASYSTAINLEAYKSIDLIATRSQSLNCRGQITSKGLPNSTDRYPLGIVEAKGLIDLDCAESAKVISGSSVTAKNSQIIEGKSVKFLTLTNASISSDWVLQVAKDSSHCKVTMEGSASLQNLRVINDGVTPQAPSQSVDIRNVDLSIPTTLSNETSGGFSFSGMEIDETKPLPGWIADLASMRGSGDTFITVNKKRWKKGFDGQYYLFQGSETMREATIEDFARAVVPTMKSQVRVCHGQQMMGFMDGMFVLDGNNFTCEKVPPGMKLVASSQEQPPLPVIKVRIKGGSVNGTIEFVGCTGIVKPRKGAKLYENVVNGTIQEKEG